MRTVPTSGQYVRIGRRTHGWQQIQGAFLPDKPVKRIQFFILMRHSAYGKAWFDKFELYRKNPDVHIGRVTMQSRARFREWTACRMGISCIERSSHTTLLDQDGGELASIDTTSPNVYWACTLTSRRRPCGLLRPGEADPTMDFRCSQSLARPSTP